MQPDFSRPVLAVDTGTSFLSLALQTDGRGTYWFKITKNFIGALDASLSSLEVLIDETSDSLSAEQKERLNALYRKLNGLYE